MMLVSTCTPGFMPNGPASFANNSKGQGSANVIPRDVREITQDRLCGHPAGEVFPADALLFALRND
jgi:hypothetical protein